MSSSFIIIVIWWVRRIIGRRVWQRRVWKTWIWIWVSWYVWYRIGLLRGVGLTIGVTIYDEESWDGYGGSIDIPLVNINGVGTREGVCTKCTGEERILVLVGDAWAVAPFDFPLRDKIFSIALILAESLIHSMFVEWSGMSWFKSEWSRLTWIKSESLGFQITELLCPTVSNSNCFSRSIFSKCCCLQDFHLHFSLRHAAMCSCWRYPTSL